MRLPRTVVVIPESVEDCDFLRGVIESLGCRVAIQSPLSGVMQVVVPLGSEEFHADLLRQYPGVRWAGPEMVQRVGPPCAGVGVMVEPPGRPGPSLGNDADFGLQWYLENTGQIIVNGNCTGVTDGADGDAGDPLNTSPGIPGVDLHIREAWAITQGCEDVVVAVFDSGIQYEHPAFDFRRFFFPDLALTCPGDNPTNPYDCCPGPVANETPCEFGFAIDTGAHGTPVAGVLAAQGNNQNAIPGYPEIAGVDLRCKVLSVRVAVAGAHGSLADPFFGAVATLAGLETIAISPVYDGVRVINMSYQLGCHAFPGNPIWDLLENAVDVLAGQGRIVVCISTNGGDGTADLFCPSRWDNVITVSGINNAGTRWDDSQHGCFGVSGSGVSVDVCAPARAIHTTLCDAGLSWPDDRQGGPPESPCGTALPPQRASGTSAAAPQVAGVVALLAARADELGVEWSFELCRDLLTSSATPMPPGPGGHDPAPSPVYGSGLVNAYAALRLLELNHYRPTHRADLTDHANASEWRFGVADGVTDCDDLAYFEAFAFPNQVLEKADFTTHNAGVGQPGYGVPDGQVTQADHDYYTQVLFPTAFAGDCE